MVSRCCSSHVYIEGTENYYYACLHCGLPCNLRPAPTKSEIESVMGTRVVALITNDRLPLAPANLYKEEMNVRYA